MRPRFGRGLGGELSYLSVVVYAMVSVIGFLSYAFKPLGKFAQPFFPMDWSPNTYALIIMLGSRIVDGFKVEGFWWALLFSILLSVVSSILYSAGKKE